MTAQSTVVLIHGMWMTPRSWQPWVRRFTDSGHRVIAPEWPGENGRTPQEIRDNPESLKGVSLAEVIDHHAALVEALDHKPIIMGHSFGGIITQALADRNLGSAYVGVAPGQPAGVRTLPLSTTRSGLPVLSNPLRRNDATPISAAHFHYTFGNDLSRAESDAIWRDEAINAYNRVFFDGVTGAVTGSGPSKVDFGRTDRAPMLLIAGTKDHVVPPAVVRSVAKRYRKAGPAVVDTKEYAGRTHRLVSQDGWEEIADFALGWAVEHQRG